MVAYPTTSAVVMFNRYVSQHVLLYMVTFTINIPQIMLAYIPAPWILWDIYMCVCVFLSQGMFHYRFSHLKVCFRCCSHRVSAGTVPGRRIWIWMRFSANFIAQWI